VDETEDADRGRHVVLACCVDLPHDGGWTERRVVLPGGPPSVITGS